MQLFSCPFCGPRDETEFTFGGEAGKTRPAPASSVSATTWARFLYTHPNPKGAAREIWRHDPCGEFFLMERDTAGHAVHATRALRDAGPQSSEASAPHAGEIYGSVAPEAAGSSDTAGAAL